jgi:hypothetical protein
VTDSGVPERLYDDEEVGRLLKRATEIQSREGTSPTHGSSGSGMSLTELEDIASEAGIDARYLRRAAAEMDTAAPEDGFLGDVMGEALSLVQETVLPGELDEEGFERVLVVLQRKTAEHGQPSLLGRTLTWQAEAPNKMRSMLVTVTARDGQTHIRAEERLHQMASGMLGGIVAGGGLGVGLGVGLPIGIELMGSALFSVAFPLGMLGIAYMATRGIYASYAKKRRRLLAELLDDASREAAAAIAAAGRGLPEGGGGDGGGGTPRLPAG